MAHDLITSTGNPRVKEALRLRRRSGRAEGDAILIDGVREIGRALDARVAIEELFVCPPLVATPEARTIVEQTGQRGVALIEVNEAVFDKIRYGDRTGGLVAVARRPRVNLSDLRLSDAPLVAVVEGTEKPGNLGAILRSADAAGIEAVLAADPIADIYGPNAIRASAGTIFSVPLVELTAEKAKTWLAERSIQIIAAAPRAQNLYTDVNFAAPTAIVLGAEAQGLSAAWNDPSVTKASVPMLGRADSLNVATTAALFFYEARRQRGHS